jgi:hypothetical protein
VAGLARISAWQAKKDSLDNGFRALLAVASTFVRAFQKPDTIGDHSFQDIRMDCSKGRGPVALVECGRGLSACRMTSILSKTAGARDETKSFLNGLI